MIKEIAKGVFIICKLFLLIELIVIALVFYINHNAPGALNLKACLISSTIRITIITAILYLTQKFKNHGQNKN